MGWKASAIIIHKPMQVDNEELLTALGLSNLTRIEDESFAVAIYPGDDKTYIGMCNDNLLICSPQLPMLLFEYGETQTEKILNRFFLGSEICSIILHSVVNLWGYSVVINGKKTRVRAGSTQDGTFIEIGEPLEEERELLSKSKIDEKGNRIYSFNNSWDEPYSEDQLGESFVFAICKRYFGEEIPLTGDLLHETILSGYKFGNI